MDDSFVDDPIITPDQQISQPSDSGNTQSQSSFESPEKAKKISEEIVKQQMSMSPKTKKILLILLGVFAGLFIVGIIVTVVILTRQGTSTDTSPTITVSNDDPHRPNIPQLLEKITTIPVNFNIFSSSITQAFLYPQRPAPQSTGDNIGIILSAINNPSQFVTVDVVKEVSNSPQYIIENTKTNKVVSNYLTTFTNQTAGGTYVVQDSLVNMFNVDIKDNKIISLRPSKVPSSEDKFNQDFNWTTSSTNTTGSSPDKALIVTFYSFDGQSYDIAGYLSTGEIFPRITLGKDNVLSLEGGYQTVLYSSRQIFVAFLFFNTEQNFITDFMYYGHIDDETPATVKIIPKPNSSGLGQLVTGSSDYSTKMLMTAFRNSVFFYYRNLLETRPTFALTDYFFLPFSGSILHCSVETDTGEWFVISTNVKKIVFGKLNVNTDYSVDVESLRFIDTTTIAGSTLANTNGPCGIGTSADQKHLFIFQADTRSGAVVFKIPIPYT